MWKMSEKILASINSHSAVGMKISENNESELHIVWWICRLYLKQIDHEDSLQILAPIDYWLLLTCLTLIKIFGKFLRYSIESLKLATAVICDSRTVLLVEREICPSQRQQKFLWRAWKRCTQMLFVYQTSFIPLKISLARNSFVKLWRGWATKLCAPTTGNHCHQTNRNAYK